MEGYFNLKVKFVIAVLLTALCYVAYLYVFKEQTPDPFRFRQDCTPSEIKEGTAQATLFFERYFQERLLRNPEEQSKLGNKQHQDQWSALSIASCAIEHAYNQKMLRYLEDSILRTVCLDESTQLSAKLLKNKLKLALDAYDYQYYSYPVNSINGEHLRIPSLLMEEHKIEATKDAEAYITRVQTVDEKIDQLIEQLDIRLKKKLVLPKFLFPKVLRSIERITENEVDKPNLILSDFNQKVDRLETGKKDTLKQLLLQAFNESFVPAYQKLYNYLVDLEKEASNEIGIWRWEEGTAFYEFKLKEQTTTLLTAEEIYDLGVEEVVRIEEEMRAVLVELKYKGDLQDFFKFLREEQQFYYQNTDEGRQAYGLKNKEIVDSIQLKLKQLFRSPTIEKLLINNVNLYKPDFILDEYGEPTILANVFGVNAVNTYDMQQLPKYTMDVMAYHELIPGHYFQSVLEKSLTELPQFRRLEDKYPAYIEGWAMYAAYLPKEVGAYQDTYSDFGRLVLELWRACHLVVDVGIHQKKWTQQMAIDYYTKHTPKPKEACEKMVERHIVLPGQAISYKIGMITILELRQHAEATLGNQFDIQEFHEVILANGAVPLEVLQDLVEAYLQTKKG